MGILGWSLTIFGLLAGLISLMTLIGVFLPRDHAATRSLAIRKPPADLFNLLENAEAWPNWWKVMKSVERLPDQEGKKVVRVVYQDGKQFNLTFVESSSPRRIVTEIDDLKKMFSGTWTYEITPTGIGSSLRITENGSIPNPFIRFMAKLMMDPATYINICLKAVAEKCDAPADIQP